MSKKRILSAIIFVCGIALIGFSMYVTKEVNAGKTKVSNAQEGVDKGSSLFSHNSATKRVGQELTGGMQKKIDEGKSQIEFYEAVASWTLFGGIACIVVGGGGFFFSNKRR